MAEFDASKILGKKIDFKKLTKNSVQPYLISGEPQIKLIKPSFHRPGQNETEEEHSKELEELSVWMSRNRFKLPRYIFMIVCLSMAMYQCVKQYQSYVSYPIGVNVLVDEPRSLRHLLPGITICDSNRIQMSKIKDQMKENGFDLDSEASDWTKQNITNLFLKKYYDEEKTSPETYFKLGTNAEAFIKYLKCDKVWLSDNEKECEQIPILEFAQYSGKCFTLFHNLSTDPIGEVLGIHRANSYKKDPKSRFESSFVVKDKTEAEPQSFSYDFAPNEIIKIMVDFQPNETTNFFKDSGGSVYVHDSRHVPGMEELFYDIEPGYQYEFYIRRISTKQLPFPYTTNCTDYYSKGVDQIVRDGMLSAPLTRDGCILDCITRKSLYVSRGVYPAEMPYFLKNPYSIKQGAGTWPNGMRWGLWRNDAPQRTMFYWCYFMWYMPCSEQCGFQCEKDTFEVSMERRVWPFKEIIDSSTSEERMTIEEIRNRSAFISIRYSTLVQVIRDFEPRFLSAELFTCGVGGLVSMWIGICIIDLFTILDAAISRLMKVKF